MKQPVLRGDPTCNRRVMAKCLTSVKWHWKSKPWQVVQKVKSEVVRRQRFPFSLAHARFSPIVMKCRPVRNGPGVTKPSTLNSPAYHTISPPPLQKHGDLKLAWPWITSTAICSPLICHLPIQLRKGGNPVVYHGESWCVRHRGHLISENHRRWNTMGQCHALLSSA